MKLSFQNIGKVAKADIEVDSITVIAGMNDTGKSTVGKLLYAVSTALHLITPHTLLLDKYKTISDDLTGFSRRINDKINVDIAGRFEKLATEHRGLFIDPRQNQHTHIEVEPSELIEFECKLDKIVDEMIEKLEKITMDENLTTDKQRLYFLRPRWNKLASDMRHSEIQDMILTEFSDNLTSEMRKAQLAEVCFLKKNENEVKLKFLNNELQESSQARLKNPIFKSFYIENPFVLETNFFHSDKSKPYLNYKHRDQLAIWLHMYDIRRNSFDHAMNKDTVKEIFSSVIDGDIKRGSQSFQYHTNQFSEPISMENVSTGIKSFAILKLLMENGGLNDCEFLILDESEIHLHPEWQLKYAELLVLLTLHYPIRILLTSHSPYFVEAIELYSRKYKINEDVRFYKTQSVENGMSEIINVTENLEELYKEMVNPFRILEELEEELNEG